jgi:hypothetical protein
MEYSHDHRATRNHVAALTFANQTASHPLPFSPMPVVASPSPPWIVRRSSIHSRGVFARRPITGGKKVIEYVGEKITKAESERRGLELMEKSAKTGGAAVYIFTLNQKYDLDGGFSWNPARLINHSCDPNCEAFISKNRVWIYARRDIAEGEELTFNYGFDMETWEDHPCRCGSEKCVGYIVDEQFWPQLRRKLKAREARKVRIADLEQRAKELKKELRALASNGTATNGNGNHRAVKRSRVMR